MLSSSHVSRSDKSILLLPINTWHNSFQSQQLQLPHPWVKSAFVLWPFFASAMQHYDFSGFNSSDRSPQHPVTALHCEMSFWQLQVAGWWVQQPSSHGVRDAGSVPHWANLKTPLDQTPTKSRMDRQTVPAPEAKTWKTNPDACLPHLAVGMSFGENSLVWHHFKHFTCQSLSSLLIKPTWHSSFTYMELWN